MSEAIMKELTCSNPDCQVAETGKCVEGFEIGECPHQSGAVVDPDTEDLEATDEESATETERKTLLVARSKILNIDEAVDILRSGPTRVLNIIGPTDSGKTTLGISLYDAFQNGPFGNWNFGGSQTLHAFEQRCHKARANSGRSKPDTPHTPIGEGLGFLHIAVHSDDTDRIDLLISDRSGEFYTRVADSLEECEELYEVSRADYVLFLIDGKRLASDERHGVKSDFMMMVETLIVEKVLGNSHRIGVILTKYDLVLTSDVKDRAEKDFDSIVDNIQKRFGSKLMELKAFRIAARPESDIVEPRYGVLEVLEECMQPRCYTSFVPSAKPVLERSFLNFK